MGLDTILLTWPKGKRRGWCWGVALGWSEDADGDELGYTWSFTTLPAGSAAALSDATVVDTSFVADVVGTYELQLIVNDGTQELSSATAHNSQSNLQGVS